MEEEQCQASLAGMGARRWWSGVMEMPPAGARGVSLAWREVMHVTRLLVVPALARSFCVVMQ